MVGDWKQWSGELEAVDWVSQENRSFMEGAGPCVVQVVPGSGLGSVRLGSLTRSSGLGIGRCWDLTG